MYTKVVVIFLFTLVCTATATYPVDESYCRLIECPLTSQLSCTNPLPRDLQGGYCCPRCPRDQLDCSDVRCPPLFCPNPIQPEEGDCCDTCLEDCRVIFCAQPTCSNPVTPPGRCCPVCPTTPDPDCAAVLCQQPACDNPVVPPGECCPICPITPPTPTTPPRPLDCERIQCFPPNCPNPKLPEPGECCPSCLEDCAVISCLLPTCDNPITPPGLCCPVCPSPPLPTAPPPIDCEGIQCSPPNCPNPIPPGPGECCPTCIENCAVTLCLRPTCDDPISPPGRCCAVCPPSPPPIGCEGIQCFPPNCPNPIPPGPGECCPTCIENCAVVSCLLPTCDNPITPPGRCCAVCPSLPLPTAPPPNCEDVDCSTPLCPIPLPPLPGECCLRCLEDCRLVRCARPNCEIAITPPGRCCRVCPPPPPSECPPDQPPVSCLINPCEVTQCPRFPEAQCVFNNCGGCSAEFFIGNREVTDICDDTSSDLCTLSPDPGPCLAAISRWFFNSVTKQCEQFTYGGCRGNENNFDELESCLNICATRCPPGVPQAACFANPCSVTNCPSFPDAICVSDFCGGCNARFFLENGEEVTNQCESGRCPVPGQVVAPCGADCQPTCENQNPACLLSCSPGCRCPERTFLDRRVFKCVTSDECGDCPPGKTPVNCLVNPCTQVDCNNFPRAECLFDNCDGCFARFFVGLKEVTSECATTGQSCPIRGQIFQQCRSCPATCEIPNLFCALVCTPGCGCPFDQVIDEDNNRCVPRNQCPRSGCPIEGQVFQQCRTCPTSCENPFQVCPAICRPGCGCPPGQIIDTDNNRCVPRDQCPSHTCPIDGQTFQICKPCLVTCENIGELIPCPRICEPGCGCPSGTVLDERNQRCVEPTACPRTVDCSLVDCQPIACQNPTPANPDIGECCPTCPPSGASCPISGQVFQQCKSCPATCSQPDKICIAVCEPGCGCPDGQLIDEANNVCVPQNQCPPVDSDICVLPAKTGPCRARFVRYFYNSRRRRCETFIYGGCVGNENNFLSRAECEEVCHECPPTCSREYCKGRPTRICSMPSNVPREIPGCGKCDVTICRACYYSSHTLPLPPISSQCPRTCPRTENVSTTQLSFRDPATRCLRKWGYCVQRGYLRFFGRRRIQIVSDNTFKCWRPSCPLRG